MHAPICLIHFGVLYIYHKRQGYDSMKKVSFLLFLVFLCLPLKARAFEPYLFHFQIQDSDKSYVDIECKPGESFRFSVVLTNRGTEVKENTLFISDGYTADNGGTKILTPKEATREAAGGWIRFSEERIALLPGEEKIIELEGRVPEEENLYDLAELFKVFGDTTRIKLLWALDKEEMCVCDLAILLNMTQSAVSHQLRVLKQARLVKFRRDGKNVYYSLDDDHVKLMFEQGLLHINEKEPK